MKILINDSHKGTPYRQSNLHWLNAEQIANYLKRQGHDVDFIWSYPSVNSKLQGGYDIIIMNHTSRYAYVDIEWIEKNQNARYFYINNDYSLGDSQLLYKGAKDYGITYEVIGGFDYNLLGKRSMFFGDFAVMDSHMVNLNTLIYEKRSYAENTLFPTSVPSKDGCIYWGSVRPNRIEYFNKYFDSVVVSTSQKNKERFIDLGLEFESIPRIDWFGDGLWDYKFSLYIEDEFSHQVFTNLANRFYESLMYDVIPLFDESCRNTVETSGIVFDEWFYVESSDDITRKLSEDIPSHILEIFNEWKSQAFVDKAKCLEEIENILIASIDKPLVKNEPRESKRPRKIVSRLEFT